MGYQQGNTLNQELDRLQTRRDRELRGTALFAILSIGAGGAAIITGINPLEAFNNASSTGTKIHSLATAGSGLVSVISFAGALKLAFHSVADTLNVRKVERHIDREGPEFIPNPVNGFPRSRLEK